MGNVEGYSLFDEVENEELQLRNRVVTIVNIIEDNLNKARKVTQQGMYLVMEYMAELQEDKRNNVLIGVEAESLKRKLISKESYEKLQ